MLKARGLSSSPWEHAIIFNLMLEYKMRNQVSWDGVVSTHRILAQKQQLLGGRKNMAQEGRQRWAKHRNG